LFRYLLGPRAAEAIFEGWLPDSIKRTEKEWDALISVYRAKNTKLDEEAAALRAAEAAKPKRARSVSPGSARSARLATPIVPAPAHARPLSPSMQSARVRTTNSPSVAPSTSSQEEIQRLRRELQAERDRYTALVNKTSAEKVKTTASDDSAEVLQLRSELARAEARLTRAFTAEELVRLPHISFGKLSSVVGGRKTEVELMLDEAGLQFVLMDGRNEVLLTASADNPVQVSAGNEGFTVECSDGQVSVEHKHCATVARLVKLWMAYKREKRRITRQRSGGHSQQGDSICPPVELATSARPQ
jgi:hypothetical protein